MATERPKVALVADAGNSGGGARKNRTLYDHRCTICGTWMETTIKKSKKGVKILMYFCPECGFSYSTQE